MAFSTAADMQITVTDVALTVSPDNATVASGQNARYVVTISPQGGAFQGAMTLTCASGNLPPGATCSFNPATVTPGSGSVQSILTIATTANGLVAPPRVRSRGSSGLSAAASGIAVFPDSLTFSSQVTGTTAPAQLVHITNIGADALTFTSIGTSTDFTSVTDCSSTLAAGQSCGVAVSFTPTTTGSRTGTLSIADNAAGTPHAVALTGTGVAAPTTSGGTPAGTYSVAVTGIASTLTTPRASR